ncbi:DUF5074 domain-containing protein [Chitinophaga pinensis]|uniref:DUF5074 domain-containing protein n=1 Tax=Chitinophaga pinensis (strain ATCC 43595 / DSM 2588 / LMG 13176 / NBRC 15968 / NCIMB 11800 / UQM 2034) TaxID=485918 RepID=A0A979GQF2_CHIPD|nr:DUF5074 domain-containing protein [Chitinophaga pinensis]ACU61402.1 hypothetical protein Cpin_3940 [Chitinophaga pinensis DSM 2588]
MYKNLRLWLLGGLLLAAACKTDDDVVIPSKYGTGFLMVTEGNYGTRAGDLNFFDYDKDTVIEYVYSAENPGKTLGPNTSTMEFGTVYNNKIYLVGKYGAPMVVLDAKTLKETNRIESLPGDDGRSFVGVDETRGLLSTSTGVFPVNLTNLTLGTAIPGVTGEVTDMFRSGNHIFLLSVNDGIVVLNTNDYSVAKKLGTAVSGFVQSQDGSVWAASKTQLKKINAGALSVDSITTNFPVYYNEFTYNSSSMVASTTENAIYIISGNNKVYKYLPGQAASLNTPFITLPSGQYFFGKGIWFDRIRNILVLNSNANLYGADINNQLYIHSAANGALLHATSYKGYFFPGMIIN